MAHYLLAMQEHNPALNELAVCTLCRGVFASILDANDHESGCTSLSPHQRGENSRRAARGVPKEVNENGGPA